jgi:putative nucleotidyltransferase with HDIG domain
MQTSARVTILFVDDEEAILDVADEFFTNKGYDVVTAQNGRQAVEILDRQKVDCCLTDISMPEMDGLALAEHIHTVDNTLPVVIMTGYPSMDNTIKTLKNGVVDFLIKPVNLNQMELCVQRVLRERRLFVDNLILTKEAESAQRLKELNTELMVKVDELNTLNKIMSDFTTVNDSVDVFKRVADMTLELTQAEEARFFVINEALGKPVEVVQSMRSGCAGAATADALETLLLDNLKDAKPLLVARNNGTGIIPAAIGSLMLVPLIIRERVFGILAVAMLQKQIQFSDRDLYYLSFMTQKAAYAIENMALYENIYENLFATLYAFVKAIEARDPYTEQHSSRVTVIASTLAEAMGCSSEDLDILNVAGRLHDIGKIGIRDDILLKPGRLNKEEFDIIKQHPVIGAEIVAQMGLWDREKKIIRCHHERYDGQGYPSNLVGEEIPLLARILSVADVYDAIASDRAYRKRMDETKILQIMYGGAGTQFDPRVIDHFKKLYEAGAFQQIVHHE